MADQTDCLESESHKRTRPSIRASKNLTRKRHAPVAIRGREGDQQNPNSKSRTVTGFLERNESSGRTDRRRSGLLTRLRRKKLTVEKI